MINIAVGGAVGHLTNYPSYENAINLDRTVEKIWAPCRFPTPINSGKEVRTLSENVELFPR